MQDSKFTFSPDELRLMSDKDFFIQKNIITKKIIVVFHELNERIEKIKIENKNVLPAEALKVAGKISKGENYLGLPYLVSDNPRLFRNKDIFAFRTMFWWGNYFSFTFHLSGKYLENYQENILKHFEKLKRKSFLICIHSEQWVHHLEKENYDLLDDFEKKKIKNLIEQNKFFKLSRKLELNKCSEVADFGTETLKEYFSILKS